MSGSEGGRRLACKARATWSRSEYRRALSIASAARRANSSASVRSSSVKRGRDPHDTNVIAPRIRPRAVSGTHIYEVKSSRSEEHTSELQSRLHLVCRLLLEKK